ncbi:type I restriction endonuclease [Shimia thalassica]|uniref:type I restriction endonuclease n=1 Tax=Shimia thalassica TaxID=1715693 RepID=UPI002732E06E|nr:type I restriction endonuclease [Shimia thalassica]MDP2494507.1 type I restriction endonuclease [Shimia thalassica]
MVDFKEEVANLANRSKAAEEQAMTEEATKTSVVLPFLRALGFDVFNLDEVVPEYIADVGTKKGEKVDFALKIDGKVSMLVEVKPISSKLGNAQFNQLFRYFAVTEARLGILTNGREAWFFSDTDAPNKMDKKPFFKFDFQSYSEDQLTELALFQKIDFAIDAIIEAASNLKYTRSAANYFKRQLDSPDEDFVRFVGKRIHDGPVTKSVLEQIKPSVQVALDEVVRDRIQDKLNITFSADTVPSEKDENPKVADQVLPSEVSDNSGIETTEEEIQAFMIIKAIGAKLAPVSRITMRDAKSYCAIIMDDNNRRPVCRLYFNSAKTKSIGIFDANKNEERLKIESLDDIYTHSDLIEAAVKAYC